MFWVIIGGILVLDFAVLKMASRCSRIEEKIYIDKYKKNID